jgi:N-acetylglucosaminyl-diphospho-decaprenol L-rhamnosyltransferase
VHDFRRPAPVVAFDLTSAERTSDMPLSGTSQKIAMPAAQPQNTPGNQLEPKVSVIIVTYCSKEEIGDCIESVLGQTVPVEIFLVDNASPDDTPELLSKYSSRFENVHAIFNKENVGLAAGNNTPLGKCRGEYLLILNPDTMFRDDSLERMVEFLDRNRDVGVVGPRNVYADGSSHASSGKAWGLREVLMWRVVPYRFPRLLHDRFSSFKTQDVGFVSGSCLLIRRKLFEEIGGYDPEYFLAIEDVCDLCARVKKTGSRVVFLGNQQVIHLTGRSAVQVPYIVAWNGNRAAVYHFLKHKGVAAALAVLAILFTASVARAATAAILGVGSKRYRNIAKIYAGVSWSLLVRNPIWERWLRDPALKDRHPAAG